MAVEDELDFVKDELRRQTLWLNVLWGLFLMWMIICNLCDAPRFKQIESDIKQLQEQKRASNK